MITSALTPTTINAYLLQPDKNLKKLCGQSNMENKNMNEPIKAIEPKLDYGSCSDSDNSLKNIEEENGITSPKYCRDGLTKDQLDMENNYEEEIDENNNEIEDPNKPWFQRVCPILNTVWTFAFGFCVGWLWKK